MDFYDTFIANCKADLRESSRTYCYNSKQVDELEQWAKTNSFQYKVKYVKQDEGGYWCFLCHTKRKGTPFWLRT